jgi:hypothetical protein
MADDEESITSDDEQEPEPIRDIGKPASDYVCTVCGMKFSKIFNRNRHVMRKHNNIVPMYTCNFCGAAFDDSKKLKQHRERHKPTTGFEVKDSAFRKKCVIYRKLYDKKMPTLENAYADDKEDMEKVILYEIGARKAMKLSIIYHVEFIRLRPQIGGAADDEDNPIASTSGLQRPNAEDNDDDSDDSIIDFREGNQEEENSDEEDNIDMSLAEDADEEIFEVCLRAPAAMLTMATNVRHTMQTARGIISSRLDDFIENGSGWRLQNVMCVDLEIGGCRSLTGSCNLVSINYLKTLKSTKPAKDLQKCFLHACAFHFVQTENIKLLEEFITKQFIVTIPSPVAVKDIRKFERDNSHLNLKINVLYLEDDQVYPLLLSQKINAEHEIVLLLYQTKVKGRIVSHYSYMANVHRMLRKRYGDKGRPSYKKTISCLNCFSPFYDTKTGREALERHRMNCAKNKPQAIKIPEKGDVVKFRNHVNKFKSHFVGFFDFESSHVKQKYECNKCEKISENDATECHHKTLIKAIQVPITCSYLILDADGKIVFNNTFTGLNCTRRFLLELLEIEPILLEVLRQHETLNMSKQDQQQFWKATHCHICDELLLGDR